MTVMLAAVAVTSVPSGAATLLTDYPAVAISRGETTTLDLVVVAPAPERVALAVVEVPPGWQTTLRRGGFVISAVYARPVEPPKVTLDVRAPGDAKAGQYQVVVRATGPSDKGDCVTAPVTQPSFPAQAVLHEFVTPPAST